MNFQDPNMRAVQEEQRAEKKALINKYKKMLHYAIIGLIASSVLFTISLIRSDASLAFRIISGIAVFVSS